jgi:glutathione S-transferase
MRLYQDSRAPNPRRVRMYLAEKGLLEGIELVEISIAARAHQAPEYLARTPLGLVPILELDDGRTLRESMAICRYFEELHPEPPMFGADPWQRAQVEMWTRHAELEVLFAVAQVFRNSHPFWVGRIKQAPEFAEIMREHLLQRLTWIDHELRDRPFLAGDRFSVADQTLLVAVDFAKISNVRLGETTPNLLRWHRDVSARRSAKA